MKVTLNKITENPEEAIIYIARVSSGRTDKSEDPIPLINHLIKNNHWSPFEHAFMTIEIVTTKAMGIQLIRHRSFTFQEFSQRYAQVSDIEPVELRKQAEKNRQSSLEVIGHNKMFDYHGNWSTKTMDEMVQDHMEETKRFYDLLIKNGVAKECARMVLPMATKTTIYMSGTIRSWIHMLDIRDDGHAQLESQLIAKEVKKIFVEQCPMIAKARGWV